MKRFAIALLLVMVAVSAQAATIYEIQTGVYAEGDLVDLTGVTVVAVRSGGVYVSEAPHGAYNGIWVYGPTEIAEGSILDIVGGEYTEYYDLSEIITADAVVTVTGVAPMMPAPTMIDAATLLADPEPYESCLITLTDGMMVGEILDYGQWTADTMDGTNVLFDDYFFDVASVLVGDCYNSVTGILDYSYSAWKVHPLVDGVELTDCTVATDAASFESVKAMYR